MPHIVQLDLSNVSAHGQEARASNGERHWLLRAIYGRDLLKAKLRKMRPDLKVKRWVEHREVDPLLEDMVDLLGLRAWPEPKTSRERVRYLVLVLKMMVAIDDGAPLPLWQ